MPELLAAVAKRLLGGSGSVGRVTLAGETKGVMVSPEATEALEALESGLMLRIGGSGGCEVELGEAGGSSEGGNGACGNGGVARISSCCCLLWHFLEVMCEE